MIKIGIAFFLGAAFGVVTMCCLSVARTSDDEITEQVKENEQDGGYNA